MAQNSKSDIGRSKTEPAAPVLTFGQQTREMLESFAVAFMLMLLMRNCLGENYQIPTGSMAPTLQGRHMDVLCSQCGYQYRTGASIENVDSSRGPSGEVTGTTCPICRFPMDLDKKANPNQSSFSGDRIIVSKLAYLFDPPKRWDVIVFKCPADAKVNYIKRLIGLPGETLRIRHGDVSVLDTTTANTATGEGRYKIARKPPEKVVAMLQVVDDTKYIPGLMRDAGWPSRWIAFPASSDWRTEANLSEFNVQAKDANTWLRYRHLVPREDDWDKVMHGVKPDRSGYDGGLITDYYTYNDSRPRGYSDPIRWVGDLAVECQVDVTSPSGQLLLDLVEGGVHFTCRVEVDTGVASLGISSDTIRFENQQSQASNPPKGTTPFKGPGSYQVRFANVDDQLFLWVNGQVIAFDAPTTYQPPDDVTPKWSLEDPGDFMPVGIGARQLSMRVSRLRVLRDVYYLAVSSDWPDDELQNDYVSPYDDFRYRSIIQDALTNPRSSHRDVVFKSRREVFFPMGDDQFFPLGDNSPQSRDARLWSFPIGDEYDPPPAVDRKLLIGKAISVYWPHAWYLPAFPVWPIVVPNFQRMGFIH